MAFRFQWPYFSDEFIQEAKTMLTNALNKGNKPAVIVDHITVKELDMGTLPPDLEILEMGELSMERFRGIFKLTYNGDAHIVLQTKVQANPMNVKKTDNPSYTRRGILAADQPLVVPMLLRISEFKLRGIIVLVVDQIKGITLVFKNDPLESVLVSSTFDSITPIQRFLQSEIEKQLRNLFQEDLPTAIHNLSQQFTKKPEGVSRQHSQDDIHGRPVGIYDGGLGTPMVSQNPSRRSSMLSGAKKIPGKTTSEPDLSMGAHYDEDGPKPARKPASATVRSESPDSGPRRDPHTDYPGDPRQDLLEESLSHHANNTGQEHSSRSESRRPSSVSGRFDHNGAFLTLERPLMRDNSIKPALGVAESTHLANQFANLIHSNQTISPYAQNLEHFTFRSVPPKRPASVQYFGRQSTFGTLSPGPRSGPDSLSEADISRAGLGHMRNRSQGAGNGYTQYRSEVDGYGQGSPRISHRRLQGRVGIRRYAMQLGAGGGPRQLSDYDSDEYNDMDEALSESEYVYVERPSRPSSDIKRSEALDKQDSMSRGSLVADMDTPSTLSGSLQTIDSYGSVASLAQSPVSRPQLSRRRSSNNPDFRFPSNTSNTMPGGFSSGVDARSWASSSSSSLSRKPLAEASDMVGAQPTSSSLSKPMLSPDAVLHRNLAAMQLDSKQHLSTTATTTTTTTTTPVSPLQLNNGHSPKVPPISTTVTARTFSSTQRHSQPMPRLPPPGALKRDKRNSSILSSRRVSSVGIGLGVLSSEGDKKPSSSRTASSQQRLQQQQQQKLQQQQQGQQQHQHQQEPQQEGTSQMPPLPYMVGPFAGSVADGASLISDSGF
ncbi:ERMES complex subunit [Dissophora globulifera]|nr:ERMES complex subunit [Dissophora globulifera]